MPTLLGLTLVLLLASAWAYRRSRTGLAVALLMGAALSLRLVMARADPFLHDFDEKYHALVAKNMLVDWTQPMLRLAPVLPYDYRTWCCNHIWLHKQPLFLWQMALSMKLFGVSEFAARLPSALLSSLLVWPVYRLGLLIFNQRVGYFAALLLTLAYYQLELISGWQSVDHSDVAFSGYVTASVWAYYESRQPGARRGWWELAVGLLAGAAVLCKWLTGLAVLAGWGLDVLLDRSRRRQAREYAGLLLALAVAVAVFMPWQVYTALRFPLESAYERQYSTRHFLEELEGQGGPWYFYLKNLWYQFQWLVLPLAAGLGLLATPTLRQRPVRPLLTVCGVVFVFFSLAATKMPSYTYAVGPLLLVVMALAWDRATTWLLQGPRRGRLALAGGLALLLLYFSLRPHALLRHHTLAFAKPEMVLQRQKKLVRTTLYRQLDALVPAGTVVLNAPALEENEAMFYSGRQVYSWFPAEAEYRALRRRGFKVAAFAGEGSAVLPEYLRPPDMLLLKAALDPAK